MPCLNLEREKPSEIIETAKVQRYDHTIIGRTLGGIRTRSKSMQFAVGSMSGCVTGYTFMKIGKVLAGAIGGGILILQLANLHGCIEINWRKVNTKVNKMSSTVEAERHKWIDRVIALAKMSVSFNAGFLGGFFIAVGCA